MTTYDFSKIVSAESLERLYEYYSFDCNLNSLKLHRRISFDEAIGNWVEVNIYQCQDCNKYWKFRVEYDSHHGYSISCIQPNQNASHYDPNFKFDESEI